MAIGKEQVKWGLQQAQDLLDPEKGGGLPKVEYPSWYGSSLQAPSTQQYADYVGNTAYQQVGGLLGGDYDALQSALQQPINQTYQDQYNTLNANLGGNGLYGSIGQDMYSGAMSDWTQGKSTALSNAVAQRYGLQMEDMQRQVDENQFAWKAGLADAMRQQGYNQGALNTNYANQEAQRAFANQQLSDQFTYDLNKNAYDRGLVQDDLAAYLSLVSGSAPAYSTSTTSDYNTYAAQSAQAQADAGNLSGWLGLAGTLGGGLLGNWSDIFGDDGSGDSFFSSFSW